MAFTRFSALFLIMMFISGISSCGKIGPLYLPDETPEPSAETSMKLTDSETESQVERQADSK